MKEILNRLVLAFAIVLLAFALESLARAQQADQDPTPVAPQSQPSQQAVPPAGAKQEPSPQTQQNASPANSNTDEDQTQDALTFTGRIVQQNGELVLNDPVTKIYYHLDDPARAKSYVGKPVKITGKLGMKKNTIHIEKIESTL
jgi:hypothetical protein